MVAKWSRGIVWAAAVLMAAGCAQKTGTPEAGEAPAKPAVAKGEPKPDLQWDDLFNGKDLDNWKVAEFGGEGQVQVKDGLLMLPMGAMLTGVSYAGELPKINYEVELEAMRVTGNDFFCGLTFPVNDSSASLICGGWGGSVCGISSLDGYDAANNETTTVREFKQGQWYKIRMRVMEKRLMAWVDETPIVDVSIKGRKVDVRVEVELCRPFGLASYQTTGAVKNVRIRTLNPEEITEKPEEQF
ncbi:MAG TPA: DUF1080 domain-containing protein [Tepidisphaeraceae bacterium]|nr:DUF1080 domain-containing protein [Tepidisphaeraceae bacterium]